MDYKILCNIKSPEDVKKLDSDQLNSLCTEIRACIIDTVSKNGGHLASNLGAVELTVALHRVFSSPQDALIFDVGHQCYTHKLLTGRFDRFSTVRTENGLSGFMRPDESEHDAFVTGHSSNSISAAFGIYKAKRILGEEGTAVAVIGDGAMTGGMAYEAMNNVGEAKNNLIIVLNDNTMSISRNVGAIARGFTRLRNRPHYHKFKFALSSFLPKIPLVGKAVFQLLDDIKDSVKHVVYGDNVFVAMGFNYLGPVDGHNIHDIEELLNIAKNYKKPSLVHVVTTKGKGYSYAESSPNSYHGVSPFDADVGAQSKDKLDFSAVAGKKLCELAEKNEKICAITAAMTTGTGLSEFANEFKNRFFDVGIAEAHAMTFAAGLARGGMIPFFAVYSSFLQRAYDQVIHDAAIAGLPVKILVDRAGVVGEDGESHQGLFDVSFLSSIPKMNIYSPSSYEELRYTIEKVADNNELCAIRYPRGCEDEISVDLDFKGEYTLYERGAKHVAVSYGRLISPLSCVDGHFDIIKLNKIFPLSDELLKLLSRYERIDFFEESIRMGCISEHIVARLNDLGFSGCTRIHAVENGFVSAASVSSSLKKLGFDSEQMKKSLNEE